MMEINTCSNAFQQNVFKIEKLMHLAHTTCELLLHCAQPFFTQLIQHRSDEIFSRTKGSISLLIAPKTSFPSGKQVYK